jgi:hypothetical protein
MNANPITRCGPLAAAVLTLLAAAACSRGTGAPGQLIIPGAQIFPESITATRDGDVIIGSIGTQQIFRAQPGVHRAEPWVWAGTDGLKSVLGVFADDTSDSLYACSNTLLPTGASPHGTLYAFELSTGATRSLYPLPGVGALCNDIALGPDGEVYATDTNNMQVVRLTPGAQALSVWAGNGAFGPKDGMLDGIAVLGSRVVVSTLGSGRMFSIPIRPGGGAGPVTEIKLSRRIERPDGIRSAGPDSVLVVERGLPGVIRSTFAWLRGGRGTLCQVTLAGDTGTVTTLKSGIPDDPVSVAVVGTTAYVLQGQLDRLFHAAGPLPSVSRPFRVMPVELGTPLAAGKL